MEHPPKVHPKNSLSFQLLDFLTCENHKNEDGLFRFGTEKHEKPMRCQSSLECLVPQQAQARRPPPCR